MKKIIALILAAMLVLGLAACGLKPTQNNVTPTPNNEKTEEKEEKKEEAETPQNNETEKEEEKSEENKEEKKEEETEPETAKSEDGTYFVDNIRDFIAALDKDDCRTVVLKQGLYNFTDWYYEEYCERDSDWFEITGQVACHGFTDAIQISNHVFLDCYGEQFILYRLNDITIKSEEPDCRAEIVIENPYATVLTLNQCSFVTLEDLVLGHDIEPGYCSGNVLEISNSDYIYVFSSDLYGCGAYALDINYCTETYVSSCVIHDCTYGCAIVNRSEAWFTDTVFRDCEEFSMFEIIGADAYFNRCSFSNLNGNMVYSDGGYSKFTNCLFDRMCLDSLRADIDAGCYIELE